MAANKFATMLHKNTHKLTLILLYALLEWILILLLLLNSFFFYLITKFANYFGLKPPCLWCSSTLHHLLDPANYNTATSYRDLMCQTHAAEISGLSFCSDHRKLAETENMCTECLASRPNHSHESVPRATRIAFISLDNGCDDDVVKCCSCCNKSFSDGDGDVYSPYGLLLKHSWKALKYSEKGGLVIEDDGDGNIGEKFVGKPDSLGEIERIEGGGEEHQMLSDVGSFGLKECSGSEEDDRKAEDLCVIEDDFYELNCVRSSLAQDSVVGEDFSLGFIDLHFDKDFECQTNRLIPVELLDSSIFGGHEPLVTNKEDPEKEDETSDSPLQIETEVNSSAKEEDTSYAGAERTQEIMDDVDEESSVLNAQIIMEAAQISSIGVKDIQIAETEEPDDDLQVDETQEHESSLQQDHSSGNDNVNSLETEVSSSRKEGAEKKQETMDDVDEESSVLNAQIIMEAAQISSTGVKDIQIAETEEPDDDLQVDETQEHESSMLEDHSSPNDNVNSLETFMVDNKIGADNEEKIFIQEEDKNKLLLIHSESNEADDEKFPETPTSVDSYNCLRKRREESIDGSVSGEIDGTGDPVQTVEKLATALKSERKALNALYTELEEERSASTIAANQTMAMINRLQEEKAAVQMEALQYQRMMEEQSEYDQEALELLNELMMKREREKHELERELDVYRKKVMDYEAKERTRMMRRNGSVRSRTSSATCSNSEDVEELSIDLNREARDDDNTANDEVVNLEEIALDCVKQIGALDDSLAEFEDERLSILDQLKALEERLITLHNNKLEEDNDSVDHSSKCSVEGFDESCQQSTPGEGDVSHSLSKDTHLTGRKTMASMVKSLLPLLDAAENETEDGLILEENAASEFIEMEHTSVVAKFELDNKKVALEDEVDHVYERLQALEADREFLKHCMSSIKKGGKGMDLLQEILQHLRDLRAVEVRVRNMSDDPLD